MMADKKTLYILWTNDNPVTAKLMVFMYGINAKKRGWFENVTLIIWGATAKLSAENAEVQSLIKEAKAEGVHVSACIACATELGVVDALEKQDIELIKWGVPFTDLLKADEKLITI